MKNLDVGRCPACYYTNWKIRKKQKWLLLGARHPFEMGRIIKPRYGPIVVLYFKLKGGISDGIALEYFGKFVAVSLAWR